MSPLSDKPDIFAKFLDKDILSEMGRLLFTLLNAFASNGYRIKLFDMDFKTLDAENWPYARQVETIDNLTIVKEIPEHANEMIYLFDRKDRSCAAKSWIKEIHVKFDIYSNYLLSTFKKTKPIFFPYPMHPHNYKKDLTVRLANAQSNEKKIRIFFSGDTEGYLKNRIHYPTNKLTRTEVIDSILDQMGEQLHLVQDSQVFYNILGTEYFEGIVLLDTQKFRIDEKAWLETLSKVDFFLCPPGYVMPMCHNVIEAMAVGAIPIINYPEWLNPSLEDMINCVTFDTQEDLIKKIYLVLNMGKDKIADMRERVIEYYRNHLDPAAFVKSTESMLGHEIELLMITDAHVARNELKLNKNSILITGRPMRPTDLIVPLVDAMKKIFPFKREIKQI